MNIEPRLRWILGGIAAVLVVVFFSGWSGWGGNANSGEGWMMQLLAFAALFILIGMWLYYCRRSVSEPLQRIEEWASKIRQGDFSARINGELGRFSALRDDINQLANWLQSLAGEKSRNLEVKSKSLQLLYDVSTGISKSPNVNSLVSEFLAPLMEVVGARYGEAYRNSMSDRQEQLSVLGDEAWYKELQLLSTTAVEDRCIAIPLQFQDRVHGEYHFYLEEPARELPQEAAQLLSSIGRNLGMAIEKVGQERESVRLSLMEERARMANELHDSLAQTLASLRFQVRTLDDLMHQDDEQATWTQMEQVESMLDEAHKELRNLIGQFRAPIDPGGLIPAIKKSVARFRTETGLPIFFHHQWGDLGLPEQWEVEIARIVQEALVNIRKHSGATF